MFKKKLLYFGLKDKYFFIVYSIKQKNNFRVVDSLTAPMDSLIVFQEYFLNFIKKNNISKSTLLLFLLLDGYKINLKNFPLLSEEETGIVISNEKNKMINQLGNVYIINKLLTSQNFKLKNNLISKFTNYDLTFILKINDCLKNLSLNIKYIFNIGELTAKYVFLNYDSINCSNYVFLVNCMDDIFIHLIIDGEIIYEKVFNISKDGINNLNEEINIVIKYCKNNYTSELSDNILFYTFNKSSDLFDNLKNFDKNKIISISENDILPVLYNCFNNNNFIHFKKVIKKQSHASKSNFNVNFSKIIIIQILVLAVMYIFVIMNNYQISREQKKLLNEFNRVNSIYTALDKQREDQKFDFQTSLKLHEISLNKKNISDIIFKLNTIYSDNIIFDNITITQKTIVIKANATDISAFTSFYLNFQKSGISEQPVTVNTKTNVQNNRIDFTIQGKLK